MTTVDDPCVSIAKALDSADGLLITAGAGMGVDSGLPDFRGDEGFWQAYPALHQARLSFQDMANPDTFRSDPSRAWGFYGHRLNLYRHTAPHAGFAMLRDIASFMEQGAFVFTSNVDGQFQKAGFGSGEIMECHGSIHYLQCQSDCQGDVWSAHRFMPEVDAATCQLLNSLPKCPWCGETARPNILMFGDWNWLDHRLREQRARFESWRSRVKRLVVIEIGAGTAIPSVRRFSESQAGFLIRINPRESGLPKAIQGCSLDSSGLNALQQIHAIWAGLRQGNDHVKPPGNATSACISKVSRTG